MELAEEVTTVEADLRQALTEIAERDGVLTAEAVVEAAREPSSPLHNMFAWDDAQAAQEYRLLQARVLIRQIKIRVESTPERTVPVRAYSRSRPGEAPRRVVASEPVSGFAHILALQARRDLQVLRRKYEMLVDFNALLREELARAAAAEPQVELGREGVAAV